MDAHQWMFCLGCIGYKIHWRVGEAVKLGPGHYDSAEAFLSGIISRFRKGMGFSVVFAPVSESM
eukprot:scaffold144527_cov17-Prasinocladus_malaysianus.AAC.1